MRNTQLNKEVNAVPGPGAYQPKVFGQVSPKYSMAGRPGELKSMGASNPGPGAYRSKPDGLVGDGPKVTMAGRIRTPKTTSQVPGPGNYNVLTRAATKQAPSYSMPGRPRELVSGFCPGPGQYKMGSTLSPTGKTMAGRTERRIRESGPGPGAYEANKAPAKASPQYSMGARFFGSSTLYASTTNNPLQMKALHNKNGNA